MKTNYPTTINEIAAKVYDNILMSEATLKEFKSWMEDGNYDDEVYDYELSQIKGRAVNFKALSMEAFNKFNS